MPCFPSANNHRRCRLVLLKEGKFSNICMLLRQHLLQSYARGELNYGPICMHASTCSLGAEQWHAVRPFLVGEP
jgi:hypothetical protein